MFHTLNQKNHPCQVRPFINEVSFYCALKALHDGNYSEVRSHVQKTRDMIDDTLTALVSESYIRYAF